MRAVALAIICSGFFLLSATADTIHVPGDQPTIQAGIDAAVDGDTVLVATGSYTGMGNRLINTQGKAITLRSENGPGTCIIDAESDFYDEYNTFIIDTGETRKTVISGFTIRGGRPAGIVITESSPTIRDCVIEGNRFGITLEDIEDIAGALIKSSTITGNSKAGISGSNGGSTIISDCLIHGNLDSGIYLYHGQFEILNCFISGNSTDYDGGGIHCYWSSADIRNCFIVDNHADDNGGGIYCSGNFSPDIRNCTIVDNRANDDGGGICSSDYSNPVVENCIIAGNSAATGDQISLVWVSSSTHLTISYSDVFGEINVDPGCHLNTGPGLIDEDPLFAEGPEGSHYLSQTAAGQAVTSPCVDTGNPESEMINGTTRTDSVADTGVVDMGFHYEPVVDDGLPDTHILSGPETGSWTSFPVVVFTFTGEDDSFPASELSYSWRFDNDPWSAWSPTTWAAIDDMDGNGEYIVFEVRTRDPEGDIDPTPEARWFRNDSSYMFIVDNLVAGPGPGPGNPPLVRTMYGQMVAYGVYRYGVNVAAGDIDGDGTDEVITGPGPGAEFGPHVRCFEPEGTTVLDADFMAYGTLKYGVNVAAGDVDGDGYDEIITGAGPGAVFGPHVRGWNWDGGPEISSIPGINFFAYGTLKYGVNAACGDIDGDGTDEIITGAGPGAVFGPHVRGWRFDGSAISPISDVNWFAFGTPKWGVNVACGDLDGDGIDEIITGAGPGPSFGAHVRAWDHDGAGIAQMPGVSFFAYPDTLYGVVVAAANLDSFYGDACDELITMPGPDPQSRQVIQAWDVDGGDVQHNPSLPQSGINCFYDDWLTHGGRLAGSRNGWVPSVNE